MKFLVDLPVPPIRGGTVEMVVDWAVMAEEAGWDSFCLWNHLLMSYPEPSESFDPWVLYSAIAAKTERIRLGPTHAPLPRLRPWKLARALSTLDRLSNGRVILGAVIGTKEDFEVFGEESRAKTRAEKLDEGLEILDGLWSGEPFSYEGQHYTLKEVTFSPTPIQRPRIPIWIGGMLPSKTPFRRAAKWDGVMPARMWPDILSPEDIHGILEIIAPRRGGLKNFEVVVGGKTFGDSKKDERILQPWIEAGATWWSEGLNAWRGNREELEERIRRGPPEV
ncbi:MAG: LLM class flavin-dependent oxidoreductase [Candidatus Thorarchaeota archaeon]|jgi:alkanesulfonate monooxygenase SsuD/methylene tetrahydromethanopterin reductase-like flavin-dependent oxidoreductase (luciferase family)